MPFPGLPTSGGGLRCWQLYQGLRSHGIEVIASMPAFTYLTEKYFDLIPEEQKEWLWNWPTQEELLRKANPDAVVFASNWDHYGLRKKPDCPLIIDLHGSRLIETSMWNQPIDRDKKVEILAKADCLLTAGTKQRNYFYGWLVQAGRIPENEHFIKYIPISLDPIIPEHDYANPEYPLFVSGGGWFPWQDQSKAIFAICDQISKRDQGKIEIFGTPHETQNLSNEERKIRDIYSSVVDLANKSPRIHVNGYVGRDDLLKIYSKANIALELMKYNLERELAFTTRTIEYLWCGMPVIYNNYSEISEHIAEYNAGWAIDPDSDEQISNTINEIFSNPELIKEKGQNAQRLVQDRFTWDKTIQPLVDFVKSPKIVKELHPLKSPIVTRASYLNPSGKFVDVALNANFNTLTQEVVVPAENVDQIEIPVCLASRGDFGSAAKLQVSVYGNKKLKTQIFAIDQIPENGRLSVALPFYRLPKGGQTIKIVFDFLNPNNEEVILRGMQQAQYPFIASSNAILAKDILESSVYAEAVAVGFVAGSSSFYRFASLSNRALTMIKSGQHKRLLNALKWRSAILLDRVSAKVMGRA